MKEKRCWVEIFRKSLPDLSKVDPETIVERMKKLEKDLLKAYQGPKKSEIEKAIELAEIYRFFKMKSDVFGQYLPENRCKNSEASFKEIRRSIILESRIVLLESLICCWD